MAFVLSRNVLAAICSDGPVFPFRFAPGGSLANATFTRASTGTYVDANGIVQTALSGVARDGNYISGTRTLLLESQATNALTLSRDLTNAAWTKFTATVALDQTGADGAANSASSFTATAINAGVQNVVTVGASTRTLSVWLKRLIGSGAVKMSLDGGGTIFNPTLTASYQRFTTTLAAGAGTHTVFLGLATSGDSIAVDLVDDELGSFASSAIPTTSAAVTRAVDALSFPGVTVSGTATLFYRYYDLATSAFVDVAAAYTSGTTITPPVDRAYQMIAVLNGTLSAAACAAQLGVP